MTTRVGALPSTYQHDRSESGTAVNFPFPGGRMLVFSSKELPIHAKPARGINALQRPAHTPERAWNALRRSPQREQAILSSPCSG